MIVDGAAARAAAPSLWELARVYLGISLLGFGGPNAHLALMLDEVVERRGWLTKEQFLELIAVTNLLPGPNSSEVAIHVGYTQRGWAGALTTGLAFLVPTFLMVTGLSVLYFEYATVPQIDALFWGVQPVIVAIVLSAGWKIGRAAVETRFQAGLALLGAGASLVSAPAIIGGMVGAGALMAWRGGVTSRPEEGSAGSPPTTPNGGDSSSSGESSSGEKTPKGPTLRSVAVLPVLLVLGGGGTALTVFLTHLWIGSVLFGGGYVLVALLEPYAVGQFGWLDAGQFLDGVALTQAVPGPISTLSAFVGYSAAGLPGAVLGTLGIYLPAFAAVLVTAPSLERTREMPLVRRALTGVVPVAAGAVVGVGATLTIAGVRDPMAALLAAGALVALVWKKVPSLWLMGAGLLAGLVRAVAL